MNLFGSIFEDEDEDEDDDDYDYDHEHDHEHDYEEDFQFRDPGSIPTGNPHIQQFLLMVEKT